MQITTTGKELREATASLHEDWAEVGADFINKAFCPLLGKLPKAANWLFWELLITRSLQTGVSSLFAQNQLESQKISRGLKVLVKDGLAYRISLQHYMVNPLCILPDLDYFDVIAAQWNSLDVLNSPGINK